MDATRVRLSQRRSVPRASTPWTCRRRATCSWWRPCLPASDTYKAFAPATICCPDVEGDRGTGGASAAFLARARPHQPMTAALARVNASWDALSRTPRYAAAKAGRQYNPSPTSPRRWSWWASPTAAPALPAPGRRRVRNRASRRLSGTPVVAWILGPARVLFPSWTSTARAAPPSTPTAQNIANLEADMRQLAEDGRQGLRHNLITLEVELVRAYDPCLSCSDH